MMAACENWGEVERLAAALLKKFKNFTQKMAAPAGWESSDAVQQCFIAAADALENFDPARGNLMPRAYWHLQQAARKSGFVPTGGAGEDDNGMAVLDQVAGGDDPAEILAAAQQFERIVALGAAVERPAGSERSARRHRARARSAAEQFLRGAAGRQGELF